MTLSPRLRRAASDLPEPVKRTLRRARRRAADLPFVRATGNADFWTRYNVTGHASFTSREESLAALRWRSDQFLFYEKFVPVADLAGKTVLDFGCGPGHDLVAIAEYSEAERIIGADVSTSSLAEARQRLALHQTSGVEFLKTSEAVASVALPDESVDFILSSGVLHHCPNIVDILHELHRILKPDGHMRVMVYNRNSVFYHLMVAYLRQIVDGIDRDLSTDEAFRRSTDGESCPYSVCYTPEQFAAVAAEGGFDCTTLDACASVWEMEKLPKRCAAIMDSRLGAEHRTFLRDLTFDEYGRPMHAGRVAGMDGCYELVKR